MGRTVLIVDDHAPFRRAARELLTGAGFEVVGEAEDGAGALREALRLAPEVVLLDVQLPDIDGFEVARRLAGHVGATILVSGREGSYRRRLATSPAVGFIEKGEADRRGARGTAGMSADVATGAVVLAAGLVALRPQRGRATGVLLCLTGVAWWAGSAVEALVFLHRGPLLHLLLAYPRGRPRGRSRLRAGDRRVRVRDRAGRRGAWAGAVGACRPSRRWSAGCRPAGSSGVPRPRS